jgi:hypothetical protein
MLLPDKFNLVILDRNNLKISSETNETFEWNIVLNVPYLVLYQI